MPRVEGELGEVNLDHHQFLGRETMEVMEDHMGDTAQTDTEGGVLASPS